MQFTTIAQMFVSITDTFPKKMLYYYKHRDQWVGLKGSDVRTTVEDISFGLKSIGINSGDTVAILSNNAPRWAMTDYGIACSGAASVSIYPTLIPSQVEYILIDSGAKVAFVEDETQFDKIQSVWKNCPKLTHVIFMDDKKSTTDSRVYNFIDFLDLGNNYCSDTKGSFTDLVNKVIPDDLLTLIYTSGTTGDPKGVMLTHNNLVSNIAGITEHIIIDSDDTFLSFLPLSHSFERMGGHFFSFSLGCAVYYAESIEKVPENMVEVGPNIMLSVPRLYEKMHARIIAGLKTAPAIRQKIFWWALGIGRDVAYLLLAKQVIPFFLKFKFKIADKLVFSKVKQKLGGNLKFFVSGGAPLAQEIAEFFASANVTILEGYGLTETSPILTANTPGNIRFGSVGRPLSNVEIRIANDGEILAKGPNIMKGYFNKPEDTAEAIDGDGWFHTGDIGEIDEDGFLKITDRKKNILVTSGGKNVAPAPMENALIISPYIEQAVVLGDRRNFISALIVPCFEAVESHLSSLGKSVSGNEAMIEHAEVLKLIDSEVENAMNGFSKYEKVKKVALLPKVLTLEEGELTPTLKVKRKIVLSKYSSYIDSIYTEEIPLNEDDL